MEQAEIETLIGELDVRVDRLRSLYDQYFAGLEKLEPSVPRRDVERRFDVLRRTQIRNTALKFRFQTLVQRYNTYQTYWQRICRQIENGTFKRDVARAKARFGTTDSTLPPATLAPPPENATLAKDSPLAPAPESSAVRLAPSLWEQDEAFSLDGSLDHAFARLSLPPGAIPPPPPAPLVAPMPEVRVAPATLRPPRSLPPPASIPPPSLGRATTQLAGRRIVVQRTGERPAERPGEPAGERPGQRSGEPAGERPGQRSLPPGTSSRETMAPAGFTLPPPAVSLGGAGGPRPVVRPAQPSAPRGASEGEAPPSTLRAGFTQAPPAPGRRTEAPPDGDLPPARVREIYGQYVEARRRQGESTANVTLDALAKSLRDTAQKLRPKAGARSVDFEVIIKDGKATLKPVLR